MVSGQEEEPASRSSYLANSAPGPWSLVSLYPLTTPSPCPIYYTLRQVVYVASPSLDPVTPMWEGSYARCRQVEGPSPGKPCTPPGVPQADLFGQPAQKQPMSPPLGLQRAGQRGLPAAWVQSELGVQEGARGVCMDLCKLCSKHRPICCPEGTQMPGWARRAPPAKAQRYLVRSLWPVAGVM